MQITALLLALALIPVAIMVARSGSSQREALDPAIVASEFASLGYGASIAGVVMAQDDRAALVLFSGARSAFGVAFGLGDRVVSRIVDHRTLDQIRFCKTRVVIHLFDVTIPKIEIEIGEVPMREFVKSLDIAALLGRTMRQGRH